ncbi:MAG: hypothetical protein FD173_2320, partial [Gallionellaceae bacterium]
MTLRHDMHQHKPPMIKYAAKLVVSQLNLGEKASEVIEVPKDIMVTTRWTKEQLKLAFHRRAQKPSATF